MKWAHYLYANQPRFVEQLPDFVRIPSVCAIDAHVAGLVAAGNWVVERPKAAGWKTSA